MTNEEIAREAAEKFYSRDFEIGGEPECRGVNSLTKLILSAITQAQEQSVLDAIAAYMIGTSSERVTGALDSLLRESRAMDKEIKGYEREAQQGSAKPETLTPQGQVSEETGSDL